MPRFLPDLKADIENEDDLREKFSDGAQYIRESSNAKKRFIVRHLINLLDDIEMSPLLVYLCDI